MAINQVPKRTHITLTQPNGHSFIWSFSGTKQEVLIKMETDAARMLAASKFPSVILPDNTTIIPKEQVQ